ncbi:MAG: response regulator [Desulfuromonas sp.]|nr:MAG: response regulator [Desulfuromonas sp.]
MYESVSGNGHIRKILIVDDEENTRIGLTKLLAADGYEVSTAGDGVEALACLKANPFHLVITDMNMPRMNGLDFIETLSRKHPGLNVIMMTAFGGIDTYVEAMKLGVYEYLHKPIKIDELKSVMKKLSLELKG